MNIFIQFIIGATKKGTRGGPGPPNKEQNWENKEQNGAKRCKIRPFWGVVIHENT